MLRGIRGAITVEVNSQDEIRTATIEMLTEILKSNSVDTKDIACVNFTMTRDLDCAYPAKFAREIDEFSNVPLMCFQELDIKNSLEKCIRVLVLFETQKSQEEIKHIYLRNAKSLRPDLGK